MNPLQPYFGEFLVNPIPLELSLNRCGFNCSFCFAILNEPTRKANMASLLSFLADFRNRQTLEAHLLQQGYPVLMSNRTDPFSAPNEAQTLKVLEVFRDLGIPVAFQTRGGRKVNEALDLVEPSVWYVSINTQTEDLRERLEPNAPTLESRYSLIETLRRRGHRVVLGMNPLVPEWMPDPVRVLERAQECGAEGVWMELLHFNAQQLQNMPDRDREAIGDTVIKRGRKRGVSPVETEHLHVAQDAASGLGMHWFSIGMGERSGFFDPYVETYGKTFPTMTGFINSLWDEGESAENRLISFEDFAAFTTPDLPDGASLPIDSYLGSVARTLWKTRKIPPRMSFRELLSIIWSEPETSRSPAKSPCLSFACEEETDGTLIQLVDEADRPLMIFNRDGFEDLHVSVDLQEVA